MAGVAGEDDAAVAPVLQDALLQVGHAAGEAVRKDVLQPETAVRDERVAVLGGVGLHVLVTVVDAARGRGRELLVAENPGSVFCVDELEGCRITAVRVAGQYKTINW